MKNGNKIDKNMIQIPNDRSQRGEFTYPINFNFALHNGEIYWF